MNVGLLLTANKNEKTSFDNLPEQQQKAYDKSPKLSTAGKTAASLAVRMGQQYITKSVSQIASLYGSNVTQHNINAGMNIAGYLMQIGTGGFAGAAMVVGEIAYSQVVAGIKDTQAKNANDYTKSTVGYISTGGGRYK